MKKKTPVMTLEKLATMVANGFAYLEEKMATKGEMNKRFEHVEENFKKIDQRFEHVDKQFEKVRQDMLGHGDRFVSQHAFDTRVSALELKIKTK